MTHPQKEYALLCEFATQSTNGLNSYMHVFDKSAFPAGAKKALFGFLAARIVNLPEQAKIEVYATDATNTLVSGGTMFKDTVKGPSMHLLVKIAGFVVDKSGEYHFWARVDGGEPMPLCGWVAEEKVKT